MLLGWFSVFTQAILMMTRVKRLPRLELHRSQFMAPSIRCISMTLGSSGEPAHMRCMNISRVCICLREIYSPGSLKAHQSRRVPVGDAVMSVDNQGRKMCETGPKRNSALKGTPFVHLNSDSNLFLLAHQNWFTHSCI